MKKTIGLLSALAATILPLSAGHVHVAEPETPATKLADAAKGVGKALKSAATRAVTAKVKAAEAARTAKTRPGKPTMPRDPNWTKRTEHARDIPYFAARREAEFPDPVTRQVRRQLERVSLNQPLNVRQSAWHRMNNFGKIGAGKANKRFAASA